jgi:hypothetical protein
MHGVQTEATVVLSSPLLSPQDTTLLGHQFSWWDPRETHTPTAAGPGARTLEGAQGPGLMKRVRGVSTVGPLCR